MHNLFMTNVFVKQAFVMVPGSRDRCFISPHPYDTVQVKRWMEMNAKHHLILRSFLLP